MEFWLLGMKIRNIGLLRILGDQIGESLDILELIGLEMVVYALMQLHLKFDLNEVKV